MSNPEFPYRADILTAPFPDRVKKAVFDLQTELFSDAYVLNKVLDPILNRAETVVSLLYRTSGNQEKIIGGSIARHNGEEPRSAYVCSTGILGRHQGKGLVGLLMGTLEEELRQKDYIFVERDARENNGYADSIRRHYGERIVFERDSTNNQPSQPRTFFRIEL